MVSQVPIVGILMIVQGSLASILGVLFMALGPLLFSLDGFGGGPFRNEDRIGFLFLLLYGSVLLTAGILNIFGGVRALHYRNKVLVITALFFNILPVFSYCFPTALGMIIYGLIVMFQQDVARAFVMGENGYSAEEIKRRLAPVYRHARHYDEDDEEDERRAERRTKPPPASSSPDDTRYYEG